MEHRNDPTNFARLLPQLALATICDAVHSTDHLRHRLIVQRLTPFQAFWTLDALRMRLLIFDACLTVEAFDEST